MKNNAICLSVVLVLVLTLALMPAIRGGSKAEAQSANLIINGNFEKGNTGFTTDYKPSPGNLYPEGVYDMVINPRNEHPAATSFGDNTTGKGWMMAVNGATQPGRVVWNQTVAVTPDSSYGFSAWVASWSPGSPAQLKFLINDVQIGVFNAPAKTGVWAPFTASWSSGSSSTAVIQIIDTNLAASGNDFALDDLSLSIFTSGCNIVNGSFENGRTGFESDYTFSPGNIYPEETYALVTDPHDAHPLAKSYLDHTGNGKMMAVNGATSEGHIVWKETILIDADSEYTFTAWMRSWHSASPATLEFWKDNSRIDTFTTSSTEKWEQFSFTRSNSSKSAIPVTISIRDTNLEQEGNDFALDDISMICVAHDLNTVSLHLRKDVINNHGGTAMPVDFTLRADGTIPSNGGQGAGSLDYSGQPDTFTLSESGPPGYTAGAWFCSGGTQDGNHITLQEGQDATCTITNYDSAPATLIVKKVVINDNSGTKAARDFSFQVNSGNAIPFEADGQNDLTVDAGTYSVTEPAVSGYTTTYNNCSNLVIPNGGSATCTITNNDQPAHLKLVKTVTNDNGGAAAATDFTLSAAGPTPLSGEGGAESDVNAGSYTLSETSLAGYAAGTWSCAVGTQNGNKLTLDPGQSATCTINNNDNAPRLHLRKVVINDDGGTATTADFTLKANGTLTNNDLSGTSPVDSATALKADTWALSETGPAGYTAGGWSCSGGIQNGSRITLNLGQEATCTITNNDDNAAPVLHLRKVVINDNGGTATTADFSLSATGTLPNNSLIGTSPVDSGATLQADTFALSESGPAGYVASVWSCTGGAQNGSSITLGAGQEATCTVTNDDRPAHLKLVKTVTNDNGGTAVPTDFILSAAGPTPLSGKGGAESDVNAGTYTLSESSLPGYAPGAWSCVGGSQNDSKISINPGQSATCTIDNNDIAPKLHLRKVVINDNGGTASVEDFTLTAKGTLPDNSLSGASPVDSGSGLLPDTWELNETNLPGYTASDWSCTAGSQHNNSITLTLGQEVTCTITNEDLPGTLVVQKVTGSTNGLFSFVTTGSGYNGFSLSGGQQNSQMLDAGDYTVQELLPLTWELVANSCTVAGQGGSTGVLDLNTQSASIGLRNGDTVTCVFKNTGGQNVTRTQGFWATHLDLANTVWFGGSTLGHTLPGVPNQLLCGRPVDTLGKLMGGFWSGISKTSTGDQRSSLDQARMQLLQQLLAAKLNSAAFGTIPGNGSVDAWESAYCGTDQGAIMTAQRQAEAFNVSGDNASFHPGGPADSKGAKAIATLDWWDVLP